MARGWTAWWLVAGLASGCATINNGVRQSILVETPGVEGAECQLTNGVFSTYQVASTPASIVVTKSGDPLNVVCKKDGFKDGEWQGRPDFVGNVEENLLLTGGLSLLLIAVDEATAAHWHYPDRIEVLLEPRKMEKEERKAFDAKQAWFAGEREQLDFWHSASVATTWWAPEPRPAAILYRLEKGNLRESPVKPEPWKK